MNYIKKGKQNSEDNPTIIRLNMYDEKVFQEIVVLANNSFGKGYLSLETLESMYGERTSLFVSLDGNMLVGYALNYIIDFNEAVKYMRLPQDIVLRLQSCSKQICYVKSEAVAPEYRGGNLAERLCFAALEDSRKLGADSAIGCAWKVGDKIPMDHIFKKLAFEKIIEIPDLWYDDANYTCAVCKGRCRCVAAIYFLSFK